MPFTSAIVASLNLTASIGFIRSISACDFGSGMLRLILWSCVMAGVNTSLDSSCNAHAVRSSSSLSNLVSSSSCASMQSKSRIESLSSITLSKHRFEYCCFRIFISLRSVPEPGSRYCLGVIVRFCRWGCCSSSSTSLMSLVCLRSTSSLLASFSSLRSGSM